MSDGESLVRHDTAWRNPSEVMTFIGAGAVVDPQAVEGQTTGDWWDLLQELGITLLVSREYEHLLLALSSDQGRPTVTYLPMPHPCGIAVDRARGVVHVACTRNPNQVVDLVATSDSPIRDDSIKHSTPATTLVPFRTRVYPGSLYLHDLAIIGDRLYANAVGRDCVVWLPAGGGYEPVWWPRCLDTSAGPELSANRLQLNSIAAGPSLAQSWFSASAELPGTLRPGHPDFAVDKRGVIFSGATRAAVFRGLTRPHSARIHEADPWVLDSGYGRVLKYRHGQQECVAQLPGWTRGLCFAAGYAIVGTSRVLPRFRQYAPGLDVDSSECGLHAIEVASGRVVASLTWASGNQIFAIETLPHGFTAGLPGQWRDGRALDPEPGFFYNYSTTRDGGMT